MATNNVSFCLGADERKVLLRNRLHFLSADEAARVGPVLPSSHPKEAWIVRAALRRADRVIVPTETMGEQVIARCPWVEDRLDVLPHPVTPLVKRTQAARRSPHPVLLCPILNAPYKNLGDALQELHRAILLDPDLHEMEVRVTCDERELSDVGVNLTGRVKALGRLTTNQVARELLEADAIFFPMDLESFGYPLAEARVNRIAVVAPSTAHAREVAGDALVPFDRGDTESLAEALSSSLLLKLPPLGENPFDPDRYFRKLFSMEAEVVSVRSGGGESKCPSRGRRLLEKWTHPLVFRAGFPIPTRAPSSTSRAREVPSA
ncbi:MAG TPA: glycosyltransferase [Acidimicrobiales bacterium]|nr:glycosyltransferase [Acidimicrobiales bacterium]